MKKSRIPVTDHAVLRYLERVEGMDIERVRREIGARVDRAADMGACGVIIDGVNYKIDGGVVATVLKVGRCDVRIGRKRRARVRQ